MFALFLGMTTVPKSTPVRVMPSSNPPVQLVKVNVSNFCCLCIFFIYKYYQLKCMLSNRLPR